MAEKTTTRYVDDIDPEQEAAFPNTAFALDGVHYEIDLSEENYERLRNSIGDFVAHARRTGGRQRSRVAHTFRLPTTDPADGKAKREWLRENGWPELGDRGRIPGDAEAAWRDRPRGGTKVKAVKGNGGGGRRAKAKVSA